MEEILHHLGCKNHVDNGIGDKLLMNWCRMFSIKSGNTDRCFFLKKNFLSTVGFFGVHGSFREFYVFYGISGGPMVRSLKLTYPLETKPSQIESFIFQAPNFRGKRAVG